MDSPRRFSLRHFSNRLSLDSWAVVAALAAVLIVRAGHVRIPW